MTLALTLAAAVTVGISLGLLGGGGSILSVPVLIYLAGIAPKTAIAMSLFVVGVTSVVGLVPHAHAGRVRWRTGLLFGGAGMAGAYVGGRLAAHVPAGLLLVAFAVMMAVTAVAMLRGRKEREHREVQRPMPRILAQGTAVGLVTGLVGAGGGFVVVPALVLLGGLSMPAAVGTSLVVIAMNSFAGLAGHLHSLHLDWPLTSAVALAAAAGSLAGSRLTGRIDPQRLRRVFGWFVIAMAAFVLAEQAPAQWRHALLGSPPGRSALAAVLTATGAAVLLARRARRRSADEVRCR
jgi:uncharacterized protein